MPKKILSLLLLSALLLSLTGCQYTTPEATTSGVTSTFAPTESASASQSTSAPMTEPSTVPETEPETQPKTEPTTVPTTEPETQPTTAPETTPTEPAEPTIIDLTNLWTPLCDYYINLRKTAGGSTILCQIPVGKTFKVLKWYGQYAYIEYRGMKGYVSANYIQPADPEYFTKQLKVVKPSIQYTYAQTLFDMQMLQALYPNLVRINSIGKSELGLDIPVMILGDPNAPKHVLMQGAIHGREHFTAWLLMAIADNSLSQGYFADKSVCYHIIPMSNPDGVIVSQTEALDAAQSLIYKQDRSYGYTTDKLSEYARQWKANGLGIDLNRNFPSGWSVSKERNQPSSSRYRGESPLCAAESKALADYTMSRQFAVTLSFHSHGSVLYYHYGNKQPVNSLSYSLALAVQAQTGYIPVMEDGTSGAGYKDWAMDELGIPSLTIEIGSSETPIIKRDMYNTYARFVNFLPAISAWLAK